MRNYTEFNLWAQLFPSPLAGEGVSEDDGRGVYI